jgi:ribonuclease T2
MMVSLRQELAAGLGVVTGGLLALILSGTLLAQFHLGSGSTPPPAVSANFDYYILSLSWAPEFCAQPGESAANPRECASGRGTAFVVHGLWPQSREGKSPESCGPSKTVSKGLVNDLLPYMPSSALIQHEWTTHGTCTGLTQDAYFTKVLLARSAVQAPVQITSITGTETESPSQIEEQFEGSNPAFPPGAFRTVCRSGALTEVRACFDKGLKAQDCTPSAGECTSPMLTIRPPR